LDLFNLAHPVYNSATYGCYSTQYHRMDQRSHITVSSLQLVIIISTISIIYLLYLPPPKKQVMFSFLLVCLSVCLWTRLIKLLDFHEVLGVGWPRDELLDFGTDPDPGLDAGRNEAFLTLNNTTQKLYTDFHDILGGV